MRCSFICDSRDMISALVCFCCNFSVCFCYGSSFVLKNPFFFMEFQKFQIALFLKRPKCPISRSSSSIPSVPLMIYDCFALLLYPYMLMMSCLYAFRYFIALELRNRCNVNAILIEICISRVYTRQRSFYSLLWKNSGLFTSQPAPSML